MQELNSNDSVVFVDDFSGTGEQATNAWLDNIEELLAGSPRLFLVLVAASIKAIQRVNEETGFTIMPYIELNEQDSIFSGSCYNFSSTEKEKILRYCTIANKTHPKGRGNCGFVIVFYHTCPNNSIPILYMDHQSWFGLFKRHG